MVDERGIEPHIPVWDKSQRRDGTFSRDDFPYDHISDTYRCPAGKTPSAIVGGLPCRNTIGE